MRRYRGLLAPLLTILLATACPLADEPPLWAAESVARCVDAQARIGSPYWKSTDPTRMPADPLLNSVRLVELLHPQATTYGIEIGSEPVILDGPNAWCRFDKQSGEILNVGYWVGPQETYVTIKDQATFGDIADDSEEAAERLLLARTRVYPLEAVLSNDMTGRPESEWFSQESTKAGSHNIP